MLHIKILITKQLFEKYLNNSLESTKDLLYLHKNF